MSGAVAGDTRVVVVCGSGGVGKTTTSAALALAFATSGKRTAVLTIDPALRLADALGIGTLGHEPRRVPLDGHSLDAMMLDMKATWDGVIRRFAPNPAIQERILANRYYRFASTRLPGSHEYMAMERLYELATSGDYDVVVLDTPPTRHAVEFLSAPDRMAGLMDDGVLHWLTLPKTKGGFRALEMGSEVVAGVLKRLLGSETISEIADFFDAFQGMWAGFRERSRQVKLLLAGPKTTFYLVTTPAPAARAEALDFVRILQQQSLPFGGTIVNRVTPPPGVPPDRPDHWSDASWAEVLTIAERQAALSAAEHRFVVDLKPIASVPDLEVVQDLAGLERLGGWLGALTRG